MKVDEYVSRLRKHTKDIMAVVLVAAVTLVVFGYRSSYLGFYADDAGFLLGVHPDMTMQQLLTGIGSYVTGRNLHILWQYFISIIAGGSGLDNLAAMHFVHVTADAINGLVLFMALRLWGVHRAAAFFAAVAFSLFPNHGETHFWLSALPMNVFSTFFVLVLLCLSALLLRSAATKNRKAVRLLVPLILVSFILAMFTYDQVVPVVMVIVTLLATLLIYQYRRFWATVVVFWSFCLATFVALMIWKINVPGGGPVFNHLTITHIYKTFQQSLDIWIKIFLTWNFTPSPGQGIALLLTASIICALYFFLHESRSKDTPQVKESLAVNSPLLFAAGGLFFIFSYLPGYLWYLSPRHSYLPSIGIAIILAAVTNLSIPVFQRFSLLKFFGLVLIGAMFVNFISANLIEKEFWISSFAMRKNMYRGVAANYSSENPTTVLLAGFPSTPHPASPTLAFLTGENAGALSIITKGKIVAERIGLHPVPSKNGYFIKTEEGRWGEDALVHIAKNDATVILFEGVEGKNLNTIYDIDRNRFSSNQFYTLTPINSQIPGQRGKLSVRAVTNGYDVYIDGTLVNSTETLALVACTSEGHKMSPAFHASPLDPERFMIPVDVSSDRNGESSAFHLKYRVSMPKIDGFRLYLVGKEGSRLIEEVVVD